MGKKLLPLLADPQDPPLGALVVVEIIYKSMPVFVDWNAKETSLTVIPNVKFTTDVSICRYLAKFNQDFKLFGESDIVGLEVDQWLTFSIGPLKCNVEFPSAISYLNQVLAIRTYLVDNKLTVADICVWAALYPNSQWNKLIEDGKAPAHVLRWYNFINSLECVTAAVARLPSSDMSSNKKSKPESAPKSQSSASERKQEGKFLKLPNAEKGHVVVRFPPEASGYLHIGHAKAALLNQYYQQEFEGKLIMRFDDTNPAKEKVDFEKVILEDVEMLKIKPDIFTRTSDHFEKLLELCEKMLQEGKAYVDDTDPEVMKNEREKRVESANRNNDVEKNMKMWKEMKEGSEFGQKCCVRAKIDMQSANGCMRDPTMYRCKNEPHPCHGNKYKVYPTYDFACPVVDSIEGVTHALRTTEYQDRDEQFYWFIEALGLRKPHIEAYSRLNMTHTVLSKRKLTWFVDNKIVDGWDDPRMPTVRGVLRHGMTVEGLRQFILAQGSSRSVVFMEWDKIWAFNKKVIDPVAPRYSAVEMSFTPVFVKGVNKSTATVAKHPKNPDIGSRNIVLDSKIIIDSEDANALKEAENTTFIGWGNLKITKINKENGNVTSVEAEPNLENKDFKNTLKLSWLAENEENTPCLFVYCDHLMSKAVLGKDEDFKDFINTNSKVVKAMIGDPDLKTLKKSDIIQIQRKGFFICDEPYKSASANNAVESPVVLMYIPDGHSKPMATSGIQKPDPATNKAKETQSKSAKNSSSKKDSTSAPEKILELIQEQGDKIRKLKGDKADKTVITAEVQVLLGLKEDFKKATGLEWKPGITLEPASCPAKTSTTSDAGAPEEILEKIQVQGDKIRILKADKADKAAITAEVQILLGLKEEFKKATGLEWKPGITLSASGNQTGTQGAAPVKPAQTSAKEKKEKPAKGKPVKEKTPPAAVSDSKNAALKKQTRLGLEARKEDNLADWYSQIITKGELIEYYDVSGCYILRPNAFAIWEVIQSWLDKELKKLGVKNCYFPIFVSKAVLEKEKDHISDFAPEVAWVTKSGSSDMAEPIAIRPTSETVMYPAYAKWIQSHRDLPIKLNQWNNVVRWEFKHPQPFIRTREFLWQEGHSAYASRADAEEEVLQILGLYEKIYSDLLAIPVVRGKKTNKEKFAGGDYTTTVEAFVSASGRAVQGATSHFLGQNFSKMFEIIYEDPETQEKKFVFQNSWGITTRTIGVMIMVHGDNQGLVIPPRVASVQVVIVPCGISASMKDDEKKELYKSCSDLASQLQESGVKVESDFRENYSPGWKFNSWELKGVPVRVELGPKDMKNNQFVAVRRDTNEKIVFSRSKAVEDVKTLLDTIQSSMLQRAKDDLNSHIKLCKDWANFCSYLDGKNIILSPFCGEISCEDKIKESSARDDTEVAGAPAMGAKSLCIPFDQPKEGISATDKCINPSCSNKPQFYTLFGRSY
ncbi:unnamed protein product [Bemisia tabaci]|uniref:Prolyl-tRNA synthetase n=1 Tax=Bemisia tabaci TaxID=7038 RepID=A0A9P0AI32_BEMTA|nr:unnamed protein product [Bemisia tabaci]